MSLQQHGGEQENGLLSPDTALTVLPGVGPKLSATLAAAGIASLGELLLLLPRRYREVRSLQDHTRAAYDEVLGTLVRVHGQVVSARRRFLPGRRALATIELACPAEAPATRVELRFFNQPYLVHGVKEGEVRAAEGILDRQGQRYVLTQPRLLPREFAVNGAVQLVYPDVPGVSSERLRSWIGHALNVVDLDLLAAAPATDPERGGGAAGETAALPAGLVGRLPEDVLLHTSLPSALRAMHDPQDVADHEGARLFFAVREAVQLFARVQRAKSRREGRVGPAIDIDADLDRRIGKRIPFSWTDEQADAVRQLGDALRGPHPMGVLLQGDVGTGKTAVAVYAALGAVARGYQVAFLAPTELLAEQHMHSVAPWLAGTEVRAGLLTSGIGEGPRREVERDLAAGELHLVFGTHSLFSKRTRFARLGLCVIDEQQRFGVNQRMRLLGKGQNPHVLVMSATPIPRTLALVMFGDLDVVVLRHRPAGRPVPVAVHRPPESWPRLLTSIERRVRRKQRVYVVCPRLGEDGEKGGAVLLHRELSRVFRAGLVHGRMGSDQRHGVLEEFRQGDIDVLVGTTVLEVGVDVPEATLMIVVACDRFGLSTLHQLRGRVGRGSRRGLCILTGVANARTAALCRTRDGFELAEEDLTLRGSGELLGRRQSGASDLRALDMVEDRGLLMLVRDAVRDAAGEPASGEPGSGEQGVVR